MRGFLSFKNFDEKVFKIRASESDPDWGVCERVVQVLDALVLEVFVDLAEKHQGSPEQERMHVGHFLLLSEVNGECYAIVLGFFKKLFEVG